MRWHWHGKKLFRFLFMRENNSWMTSHLWASIKIGLGLAHGIGLGHFSHLIANTDLCIYSKKKIYVYLSNLFPLEYYIKKRGVIRQSSNMLSLIYLFEAYITNNISTTETFSLSSRVFLSLQVQHGLITSLIFVREKTSLTWQSFKMDYISKATSNLRTV